MSGWWDYNNQDSQTIIKNRNYFDGWIPLTVKENELFIQNVIQRASKEYEQLQKQIISLANNNSISKIVIITHSVPMMHFCSSNTEDTEHNTLFEQLINNLDTVSKNKISDWIFGHTHQNIDTTLRKIHFIANPRGRPKITIELKVIEQKRCIYILLGHTIYMRK